MEDLAGTRPHKVIAIISSQAFSIVNFRGTLIRDLVANKFMVYALAPDFDEPLRRQVVQLGASPVDMSMSRTGINPLRDTLDTARLACLLRRLKPDVCLSYFIKPAIFGTLAAFLAKVPKRVVMIEGLGYIFTDSGEPLPWRRRLLKFIVEHLYRIGLSKADSVIFLNKEDTTEFISKNIVSDTKAVLIDGIGIDLKEWLPAPAVIYPVTFIMVARLLREKGVNEFAEAARRVKAIHPQARFILLGGMDLNPGGLKENEVRRWVAEGILEWPGHVEVKPWVAQSSVFVLPSYYREGLPRSTLEAMAMGRAVITTDTPGCRETVVDGVNGYLVAVRNPLALASAMLRFADEPELIVSMGNASRRLAEERFDVQKINQTLQNLLVG